MTLLASSTELDQAQMARLLGTVSVQWLDPSNSLRREAVEALTLSTGLSPALIGEALEAAFSQATEQKILDYIESEPVLQQKRNHREKKVLHILPGNVFTAWIPGALTTLLSGYDCWLKPSALEPVFAPFWKRSVMNVDEDLSGRIRITSWDPGLLSEADAVIAYGSDETLASLRSKTPKEKLFIGYGHKMSVAVIFQEALQDRSRVLDALRQDVLPFNLQGCLSPQRVYVEKGDLPPLSGLTSRGQPLPVIRRFEEWDEVKKELTACQPHLSALGYAGPESRIVELTPELEAVGFSRICLLGEMQRPPLTWRNGGISLAEILSFPA